MVVQQLVRIVRNRRLVLLARHNVVIGNVVVSIIVVFLSIVVRARVIIIRGGQHNLLFFLVLIADKIKILVVPIRIRIVRSRIQPDRLFKTHVCSSRRALTPLH